MTTKAKGLPVLHMTEWVEAVEKLAGSAPAILNAISRLRKTFSKRGGPKRDLKKIGDEIDDLKKDFETLCVVMTKHVSSITKFTEAIVRLVAVGGDKKTTIFLSALLALPVALGNLQKVTTLALAHETRLKALEAEIAKGKGKRGRKVSKKPKSNEVTL